jgi:predicted TPR repeat methyltransferase
MPEGLADQSEASVEEIVALYEDWASSGTYDRDVEDWGYEAPERCAQMVATVLARCPGSVLDAGCGTGLVGVALTGIGVSGIVGGDVSPSSTSLAQARGVYDDLIQLDLNGPLELESDSVAVTVSVGVFTYVVDLDATLRELLRIVVPGGAVIFTQRTDLWDDRECDSMLTRLVDDGLCAAEISDPQPYLPGHPDFGDAIHIRYVTLTRPE